MNDDPFLSSPTRLRRRRVLQGIGAAGALAGWGPSLGLARAAAGPAQPQVLRGTEFNLEIAPTPVNITGTPRIATAVNGQVPAPTLVWREGDTVTLRVTNRLPQTSSIHWHGILVPANMDGVPGLSFMTRYTRGDDIRRGAGLEDGHEYERDSDLAYTLQDGPLKGLSLRWRNVTARSSHGADMDENRLIANYSIPIW